MKKREKKAWLQHLEQIHAWMRIVDAYRAGNPVKTCPFCGEKDALDISVTEYGRVSYTVVCRMCGEGVHLDGTSTESFFKPADTVSGTDR